MVAKGSGWFEDAQRIISLIIILLFVALMGVNAYGMVRSAGINDIVESQKQLINALINIVMVVIGFYFGSSKSSQQKDETASKVAEKLAEKAALPVLPGPPVAPVAPVVSAATPWWDLLTAEEKGAIEAAAVGSGDARVAAFMALAKAGAATRDDLDYLVSMNLLAADRADAISKVGVS